MPADGEGDELVTSVERETEAELERTVEEGALVALELERTELETLVEEGVVEVEPQPKAMLLSCHVAVVEEKPDQTKPVIALALAPEN